MKTIVEPRIQYAKTSDGVNIAYYAIGSGPPFIIMSPRISTNIEDEWNIPPLQNIFRATAMSLSVVRFDMRGCGLSDRNVADFSPHVMMRDLETLADVAAPGSFALHASGTSIPAALTYDSTALTERLGDAAFRGKARDLDTTLRTLIRENAGTPIEGKLLGDGVLATFTSARQAIEAALSCGRSGDDAGLPLHLGLHAGDVIREDNNVYGGAVNIASRISGLSAPGEVLVSETVRSLARTSAGVSFEDRGEQALKGIGETVRVWAAREAD